jgi:hypothetical protein
MSKSERPAWLLEDSRYYRSRWKSPGQEAWNAKYRVLTKPIADLGGALSAEEGAVVEKVARLAADQFKEIAVRRGQQTAAFQVDQVLARVQDTIAVSGVSLGERRVGISRMEKARLRLRRSIEWSKESVADEARVLNPALGATFRLALFEKYPDGLYYGRVSGEVTIAENEMIDMVMREFGVDVGDNEAAIRKMKGVEVYDPQGSTTYCKIPTTTKGAYLTLTVFADNLPAKELNNLRRLGVAFDSKHRRDNILWFDTTSVPPVPPF